MMKRKQGMTEIIELAHSDQIFSIFREYGNRHYGENVSELEHALQTAEFARQFGEADSIVLSCLLHDYGHMLHDLGEDIAQHGIDAMHEQDAAIRVRLINRCDPDDHFRSILCKVSLSCSNETPTTTGDLLLFRYQHHLAVL